MKQPIMIRVAGPEKGLPLITLLARKMSISRNEAKRLIDSRRVFVNQQRVWMARHEVEGGDRIEVHGTQDRETEAPCPILWQDDYFLIIDKPAGWLANGPGSIEERVSRETGKPVHAVHRLDRDTSGCMLLAWRKSDGEKMIPVFQRREVQKIYEGLVVGKATAGLEVIDRDVQGESALTLVKTLRKNGQFSRMEFTLITGRTHQIRRHLHAVGLHLAGEKNYGATTVEHPALRTMPRHMLHAKTLGFPHPFTEKTVQIRAPLPADYRRAAHDLGV
ncbi:MAG TPA: RluA family pseudouridine synthase [Kiritimatiellia bacterium]|nr:RluA family pseudouridine synthase [Kiritimatiellia bacterium]HMO98626.1 RluA family pseudouridine synthase [Kiritimatiellia bacterium]HMP96346.1 RluA family pseudouridine synthase [Kiritimatiellia bacterium]